MKKESIIILLLCFCFTNCQKEKRIFWVDSGTDYHVLTDVNEPFLTGNKEIKVLRKQEILSANKHQIAEMQPLFESDKFTLKVYYLEIEDNVAGSSLSLRTTDSEGNLIDVLNFSNWPSTEQRPFCESVVYQDLSIKKLCEGQTEWWELDPVGNFRQRKPSNLRDIED